MYCPGVPANDDPTDNNKSFRPVPTFTPYPRRTWKTDLNRVGPDPPPTGLARRGDRPEKTPSFDTPMDVPGRKLTTRWQGRSTL